VAARSCDEVGVRRLIENGADVSAPCGYTGRTALHFAAHRNKKKLSRLLLRARAPTSAKDHDGNTPLHLAAQYQGYGKMVNMLLGAGADPNAMNSDGRTPLHHAAGRAGDIETILILINAGADVTARDRGGQTP
ncbi:ankyrin repeat-containing domain protein, partial [Baffinella frigidus]